MPVIIKTGKIGIKDPNTGQYITVDSVYDGATSPAVIDDTAGEGDTDKAWSADKLTTEFSEQYAEIADKLDAPTTAGTNGQVLTSDGNGGQVWADQTGGGGNVSIDDTAGAGNTDKVWSANKDTEEVEEVKGNFSDLITVLKGYDMLNATLTEDKYANYTNKTLSTLSGCTAAEFSVTTISKFKYKHLNILPDSRGLYFVDKDGTALSTSYQAIATVQDITVPDGAVKCYATVESTDDIEVYHAIAERPEEILKGQATYTNKDNSGGIKYTWSEDHSTITIVGTRTGTSFNNMAGSTSTLPTGIVPGNKYTFAISAQCANLSLSLVMYENGTNTITKAIYSTQTYQVPSGITGMIVRISVGGSGTVVNETIDCPAIYTVPDFKSYAERLDDLEDAAYGNSTNPLAYIRRDAGMMSLFHTVGCIGDSLSSGECAYNSGGETHYIDLYAFSWGQCLARMTGNTYHNWSAGGLTTKTWLASSYATECFDGNHLCDAYFIGLGQNDKNTSMTVGTTADIDLSDYTNNADTYCGNYGKIIQKIREVQPKAPIFVFIDPAPPSGDTSYNAVLPGIVALFDNVWTIDLMTYGKALYTEASEIIGSQLRSGHYSALGYQEMAFVIATYVDWIVRNNLEDFSQVEFIGANYSWTD